MPVDHIRYDLLAQDALRGLVRKVLADAAKRGLPAEHHFFITFNTEAEGVRLSPRLREQYPQEMTIVLQHQFWDLKVAEELFEVGLSFGGVAERLVVPFEAVTHFADPSVQFQLHFQAVDEAEAETPPAPVRSKPEKAADESRPKGKSRAPAQQAPRVPASPAPTGVRPAAVPDDGPPENSGGAEVVRLDRFRKK
jgi:hypothetical protein